MSPSIWSSQKIRSHLSPNATITAWREAPDVFDNVRVSVFLSQVEKDRYTHDAGTNINDVELIYDACPTEKQMIWIGLKEAQPFGTAKRFDGYAYFNQHPDEL